MILGAWLRKLLIDFRLLLMTVLLRILASATVLIELLASLNCFVILLTMWLLRCEVIDMLIPMFSFRDKVEKLYTIPLCFANIKSARSEMKQALDGEVVDFFSQVLLVAEFNPETGEMFSVGEDVSAEFNILPVDPEESEVSENEESPIPSEISEAVS